ncbi:cytochrome c [Hymenobacter gummosus]|uniref:Cytochrome c n=1 Tax=Hymenobacter gummosus TaxID=1776032 RepID=A0A3S0JD92_9BACT|nr:cytochrome c [Hymenobacter gummosus]RTQ48826.1 cytochrome c [Hymenobacter gummosus]
MSRNALTLVFPAAVVLLVCSLVVLFLTATGLEPGPLLVAEEEPARGCGVVADSATLAWRARVAEAQQRRASLTPADAAAVDAGDALFKSNCAQCHAIDDVVVGPALAGIGQRRPLPWIVKWVQNSSRVVASGDEYGVKLFNQYQKQQMPSFQLSAEQIQQIMKYVEVEAGNRVVLSGAQAVALN